MIHLYDTGVYLVNGTEILADDAEVAARTGKVPVNIKDFEAVCVSYPGFLDDIERLAR